MTHQAVTSGPGGKPPLVIVPALNEEAALPGVLATLREQVPWADVLVVDDGSTDGTADLARAAGVGVASLPFNLGIGAALRTGFSFAVRQGYQQAVQLDGDGQHDPASIPRLLAALDGGADMVVGSRFAETTSAYVVGSTRRRAMRFMGLAIRIVSGTTFTDVTSGYRAFSRPVLEFFARAYPAEYMESTESLLLALDAGFRVAEVPVTMRPRAGGRPSQRKVRLPYHYVRLLVVIATSWSRRSNSAKGQRT